MLRSRLRLVIKMVLNVRMLVSVDLKYATTSSQRERSGWKMLVTMKMVLRIGRALTLSKIDYRISHNLVPRCPTPPYIKVLLLTNP